VNDHLATRPIQKEDWEVYTSPDEDDTDDGSDTVSNPYEIEVRITSFNPDQADADC
jgi:hypothetical protein